MDVDGGCPHIVLLSATVNLLESGRDKIIDVIVESLQSGNLRERMMDDEREFTAKSSDQETHGR